jgi:hypothetical protein
VAQASVVTFDGELWEQSNSPNIGVQLGVNPGDPTNLGGATFGPNNNANMTRTSNVVGFIEGQLGADTSVGYLSRITDRRALDPSPGKLEISGTRAVNIPQSNAVSGGNIGTALTRRGIQVGWTPGTNGLAQPVLGNGVGTDFIVWESGDANEPDAMMTRVRNATTQLFTDWFFVTPEEAVQAMTGGSKLFKYSYDLTLFGLGLTDVIDLIEIANMVSTDRIDAAGTNTANGWVAEGAVLPEAGGAFSATNPGPDPGNITPPYGVPFGNSTYDPDPLYISAMHDLKDFAAVVPEPASILAWIGLGLGTAGAVALKNRRKVG